MKEGEHCMLIAPDHSVVGAFDLLQAQNFFESFGLAVVHSNVLPREVSQLLYGLEAPTEQVIMRTPGAISGVRLVKTPHPNQARDPLDTFGFAIDIYVRDMNLALEFCRSKGYETRPVAQWSLDGKSVQECLVIGPNGLQVVIVSGDVRRPSLLDQNPSIMFSEILAFVNFVEDAGADQEFWTRAGGLTQLRNETFDGSAMYEMLHLPRKGLEMRFALYWTGADSTNTAKVELVSCETSPKGPKIPLLPQKAEFGPVAFILDSSDSLAFASSFVADLEHTDFVHATLEGQNRKVVRAISPAGVAFELWCKET
jgi:hypothetical protein